MVSRGGTDQFQLGFLRVVELGARTYAGGLLVTNRLGRPLEFQCTTPVRPTRSQEILYGQTLEPFLFGELIGKTLMDRLAVKPDVVIVEQGELLELREHVSVPVGCVVSGETEARELPDQFRGRLGQTPLRFHRDFAGDVETVQAGANRVPEDADLAEPLERVKEALTEALRSEAA